MNIRKTSLNRVGTKTLYLVILFALGAVAAAGFLLVPTNTNTVSAQDNVISAPANQVSHEILSRALDFRTATEFAVFAEKGITDNGDSKVGGDVGVGAGAEIEGLNRDNVKGMLRGGEGAEKIQKDFANSFSYINYLPCAEVTDTNLGGKTFTPGVYCLPSAALAGQVTLNADDASGIFIFKVAGALRTKSGSGFLLMNEAKASNVFFITNDSATVTENSDFTGSILAKNNISIRSGSTVTGRTLSLNGAVELENATIALQTGFLQICKTAVGPNGDTGGLDDRAFSFRIGGQTFTAPVGGCTQLIEVASGSIVVEELLHNTNLSGSDAVTGRFILTSVTKTGPGTLGAVNLSLRVASVTVPEGGMGNQTVVTFNNQFAAVGFVEICKEADNAGVGGTNGGIFAFQIRGVFNGAGQPGTLATFFAPVGQCTGLIAVPISRDPLGVPVNTFVDVTEIVPRGTTFTGAFTIPANRLIAVNTTAGALDAPNHTNPETFGPLAGRSVRAMLVESSGTGDSANQTTIFFRNQSEAVLKICKSVEPGIPIGTEFVFRVRGRAVSDALTGLGSIPVGTLGPEVDTTVTIPAGPAQVGGFCKFVPASTDTTSNAFGNLSFQTGSGVTVIELGTTTDQTNPITIEGINGQVQVLRITNLDETPGTVNLTNKTISFNLIAGTNEVEFVNFIFNPGLLKVCKVAGEGVTPGEVFTFDVTTDTSGGLLPAFTRTFSVRAGPRSTSDFAQNGFCVIVNGPFTSTGVLGTAGLSFFNQGSTVTVTERSQPGITTTITSPTSTGFSVSGNAGTFSGVNGIVNVTNEIVFVNSRQSRGIPTPIPTVTPGGPTPSVSPTIIIDRPTRKCRACSRLLTSF